MANELDWLRSKARKVAEDVLVITPDDAARIGDVEAGSYRVEYFQFEGTISYRMARALSGSKLISTDTEHETLRLGTGYRGGEGACFYGRAIYTLLEQ